jgi:endogenous inhibitor of DNA gyrase (YacG/DUF329 family)
MTDESPPTSPPLCSICRRRPVVPAFRPFCSRRCADVDLARWLGGGYRIPDDEAAPVILDDEG